MTERPARGIDRHLGWSVDVVQLRVRTIHKPVAEHGRQRLTSSIDDVEDVIRVAVPSRFGDDEPRADHERPQQLPDREFESHWRLVKRRVTPTELRCPSCFSERRPCGAPC